MDEPVQEAPVKRSRLALLTLIAVILAAGLAALFWLDARQRIGGTQEELARRLRDIEGDVREARSTARQAQELVREAQAKIGQLESRLAESQSQQLALEALYQELSRNRDEWQLAEIEQVLAIGSQQLQLAGNIRAALLALQLAEARLARADRPQFVPIRRALARDLERVKALPAVDIAGMSTRLNSLVAAVDSLPLAFDERSEREPAAKSGPADAERGFWSFWSRLGSEIRSELRSLVVVRQVNTPDPPLLPPTQAYFLRENLRLRLLNARLSLLMRDEAGYREDMRAAQAWVRRYFDTRSKQTADALAQLKTLSSASLSFEMPSISESLEAVRGFKSRRERAPAALAAALQAYYEGRYARAEKEAAAAFEAGPTPGLAALLAARAAHQMRDFERRDRWLERADEAGEGLQAARLVSRAEFALEERDFAAARDALRDLHEAGPKHIATTRMLLRAERGAGAWDEVLRLATQLAKRDAISPALAEEYKVQANVELLRRSASYPSAFEQRWRGIPASDQLQPRVAAAAARHATTLGKTELARDIIEKALAAEWTPQLVALYGDLPPHLEPAERAAEARARIERGDRWLPEHERDAQLLARLGPP